VQYLLLPCRQLLGPGRLCEWFRRFGLGQPPGTGLIEESAATLPTSFNLRETQQRGYQPSDAWNFSIGQGEVTITPLQAAQRRGDDRVRRVGAAAAGV